MMTRKNLFLGVGTLVLLLLALPGWGQATAPTKPGPFNPTIYEHLRWRNIGPFRGGRCVAVAGVTDQPLVYYMGATGGGVWKTEDAGISWTNISDGAFHVGSIGAIAVAEADPNIILVGSGEHTVRGVMSSHGDGLYKSLDGGRTWKHLGLTGSRHIAAIRIHPRDPDVIYVAVQGAVFGPSAERGVYRSTDGGKTWQQVFFINETTGACDLSMDINNPRILYVSMWDHQRFPWQIRSGGPGSGIFKTIDAGDNWVKLGGGLPDHMGKAGVAVSPANPKVIYANVEAEEAHGGVFRSDDGGESWEHLNNQRLTTARAWYYMKVVADPKNERSVYVLNAPLLRSTDGGRSFETISNPHSDQHALWINPLNPRNMILGNDGGACITFNGGVTWSSQYNQPTGQFYRAITDNRFPYFIYGGQQDYESVAIASRTTGVGIGLDDWHAVAGGESAFLAFDPKAPDLIYGGSYQGVIEVYDRATGLVKNVMAYPAVGLASLPREMKYRFNWNAPIVASIQDPRIIYHAANVVLRTRDGGITWHPISPDLTRDEESKQGLGGVPYTNEGAGAEVYNTISYLACSPHDPWVIWAGSDDGLVHVTRDEGQSWNKVTPPNLGEALINCIEVSPHDPATAYVVATRHKFNDFTPLVYLTKDFGKTWTQITRGFAPDDFVRVVREDPLRAGLLYAGTETGFYLSYNQGASWRRFQLNLPVCPVTDLVIRDNDLIASTSGRGFWIFDNLISIQYSAGRWLDGEAQLFPPKATAVRLEAYAGSTPIGMGENPLPGVIIDYYLPAGLDTLPISLSILDKQGRTIRRYSSVADTTIVSLDGHKEPLLPHWPGINRFNWDLRRGYLAPMADSEARFLLQGGMVAPGDYTIRLEVDGESYEQSFHVEPDPRLTSVVTPKDYTTQDELLQRIELTVIDVHQSVAAMRLLSEQIKALQSRLEVLNGQAVLIERSKRLSDQIDRWINQVARAEPTTEQDMVNVPASLKGELLNLHERIDTHDPRLTKGAELRFTDLHKEWGLLKQERESILQNDVKAFNQLYKEKNLPALLVPGPLMTSDSW